MGQMPGINFACACCPSVVKPLNILGSKINCLDQRAYSGSARRTSLQQAYLRQSALPSKGCQAFANSIDRESMDTPETLNDSFLRNKVWRDLKRPRICILGGGFGGLFTALQLESLVWPSDKRPQVLLVDQADRFVFKPLLYDLLTKEFDQWEIAPRFTEILSNTSVQFRKGKVKTVLPYDRLHEVGDFPVGDIGGLVTLEGGYQIEYDWLVLSLGSEALTDIVPGSAEYALPFYTLDDVLEVDKRLRLLEQERFGPKQPPIQVAIVGSGYCGVEAAATLAERLSQQGKVMLIDATSDICSNAVSGNREVARKVLSGRNVELHLGFFVTAIRESSNDNPSAVATKNHPLILDLRRASKMSKRSVLYNSSLQADLVLWTVGSRPCLPADIFQGIQLFSLNSRGQIETDETLRVKGHSRTFALGDSACLRDSSGKLLPSTAQVALQQADYAGWNLWAAINNKPLIPFRFQKVGELMTLGMTDAAVTFSFIDGLTLEGPLGHLVRKLSYIYRLPTTEHRLKVGLSWLTKSAVDVVAKLQEMTLNSAGNSS